MSKLSTFSKVSLFSVALGLLLNCAGSAAKYRFDQLNYPVSMSPYLYDSQNQVVAAGDQLKVVKNYQHEARHWAIFYGLIDLSDTNIAIESINNAVKSNNGVGIVNFKLSAESCIINSVPVVNILPFWPGCTIIAISGDIVKMQ